MDLWEIKATQVYIRMYQSTRELANLKEISALGPHTFNPSPREPEKAEYDWVEKEI